MKHIALLFVFAFVFQSCASPGHAIQSRGSRRFLSIKGSEMIMKKIFIIMFLNSLFVDALVSQTLFQQIEKAYNALDTLSYIENLKLSFREETEKKHMEMDNTILKLYGFDYIGINSIKRQNILDSIDNIHRSSVHFKGTKTLSIEKQIDQFRDKISAEKPIYVLNLLSKGKQTLQVDTEKLAFNLFYFDKHFNPKYYVFVENGRYTDCNTFYPTFSTVIARNTPKVFRRILQKHPQYLLYCYGLEEMNSILYVLNNNIYVYRIAQMKEYKLNDYIKNFGISK